MTVFCVVFCVCIPLTRLMSVCAQNTFMRILKTFAGPLLPLLTSPCLNSVIKSLSGAWCSPVSRGCVWSRLTCSVKTPRKNYTNLEAGKLSGRVK